jgi:hypothetical protein
MSYQEAMILVASFICGRGKAGNNAKTLEAWLQLYPFCFQEFV